MNYYTNELNKLSGKCSIKVYDENGNVSKTLDINDESHVALIEWLTIPEPRKVIFTRVNSDSNGNPRYVIHYSTLHDDYETALKMARTFGGRKFHNKQYGGGIIFQSYNLGGEVRDINRVLGGEIFAGYTID